jgi:hypothetical protein
MDASDTSVDATPCVVPPEANTYNDASGCMPIPGPSSGGFELRCYVGESVDGATYLTMPLTSLGCSVAGPSPVGFVNYICPCAQ